MEGKANIQIGQVNNLEKQKVSLTYYVGPFDSVEEAQTAKYAIDNIAEELGATVRNDTVMIGEVETKKARKKAEKVTEKIDEKNSNSDEK